MYKILMTDIIILVLAVKKVMHYSNYYKHFITIVITIKLWQIFCKLLNLKLRFYWRKCAQEWWFENIQKYGILIWNIYIN